MDTKIQLHTPGPSLADQLAKLKAENAQLRYHLTALGKAADRAALILAEIEADSDTEELLLQAAIDDVSNWARPAILGEVVAPVGAAS